MRLLMHPIAATIRRMQPDRPSSGDARRNAAIIIFIAVAITSQQTKSAFGYFRASSGTASRTPSAEGTYRIDPAPAPNGRVTDRRTRPRPTEASRATTC